MSTYLFILIYSLGFATAVNAAEADSASTSGQKASAEKVPAAAASPAAASASANSERAADAIPIAPQREVRWQRREAEVGIDSGYGFQTLVIGAGSFEQRHRQADQITAGDQHLIYQKNDFDIMTGSRLELKLPTEDYKRIRATELALVFDSSNGRPHFAFSLQAGIGVGASSVNDSCLFGQLSLLVGNPSGFQLGYVYQAPMSVTTRPPWLADHVFALRMHFASPTKDLEHWRAE